MVSAGMSARRARPAPTLASASVAAVGQPNEFDLRRVLRALDERSRYRYVTPQVEPVADGYRIQSPCCSRNVDSDGGVIDIARIEYAATRGDWLLYRKDHRCGVWVLHACGKLLTEMLTLLQQDPARVFWP